MGKRHRWINNRCLDCDMTRRLEDARSQRGCYGYYQFKRMIYRNTRGAQVWWPGMGSKVPPCRPPRLTAPDAA